MRICLVSQEYPPETAWGGIAVQTRNKAVGLAQLGHDVHVLTRSAAAGTDMRVEAHDGVTVHLMQPPGLEFPLYSEPGYLLGYSWCVLRALNLLMKEQTFDVIDFPEFGGEGFAYQVDRRQWNWAPVVVQLHGPLAMCAEYMDWPKKDGRYFQVGNFMEDFSVKRADGLMACSAAVADLASRYYLIPRESIDVIHCGVDTEMFHPIPGPSDVAVGEKLRAGERRCETVTAGKSRIGPDAFDSSPCNTLTDARPTVLFVGYVVENKGAHILVDAMLRLRNKYPTMLCQFVGHTNQVVARLRSQIIAAGAEENFEFTGFVKPAQLPAYYRNADVFCAPAAEFEGFGQTYLEAMACGCPVVASTAGGANEAVTDGQTGLLITPNDVAATALALDRLLANAPFRNALGRQGRERAQEYFSMDKYVQRVLASYRKAIERSLLAPDRDEGPRE